MSDQLGKDIEAQLRKDLEAAFQPLKMNLGALKASVEMLEMRANDVQFEFHSATVSEDGAALLVLFEGTDGHDYACTIPQGEKLGQQATLRRVD